MGEFRLWKLNNICAWLFLITAACLHLSSCAPAPSQPLQRPVAIAVWNLDSLSLDQGALPDLGEMLALQIAQTIREKKGIMVVEREQLEAVLQELNIGSSELADEATRLRLGRLAGATHMIFGSYITVGSKTRFDMRLVEVETAKVIKAVKRTVDSPDLDAWFRVIDEASIELVDAL